MSAQTSIQIRSAFPLIVATAMLVGGLNTTHAASKQAKPPTAASVDPEARERVASRYTYQRQYGARLAAIDFNENAFEDVLAKTTYYSAEPTDALKTEIPIVMTPTRLTKGGARGLKSRVLNELREGAPAVGWIATMLADETKSGLHLDIDVGEKGAMLTWTTRF